MEFTDRVLKCIDCGAEFVFTAGEQLFFHDKQFMNDPKRCKQCKAKRGSAAATCARRNADYLFRVWRGDNRAVQAHPGPAGSLPFLLPEAAGRSPAASPTAEQS